MRKVDEMAEQAAGLRRRQKITGLIVAAIVLLSGIGWWQKTSSPERATLVAKPGNAEASHRPPAEIVVYVSGLVSHPGVLKVPAGVRVLDAVNAAGGLLQGADITKINLALPVKDGMQVHIPGRPPDQQTTATNPDYPATPAAQPAAKSSQVEAKININTATATELDKLPGVGPALAGRIVEYRSANGSFKEGADLKNVKGLGAAKYEKLKDKIVW
jgi:competence protein ComEA